MRKILVSEYYYLGQHIVSKMYNAEFVLISDLDKFFDNNTDITHVYHSLYYSPAQYSAFFKLKQFKQERSFYYCVGGPLATCDKQFLEQLDFVDEVVDGYIDDLLNYDYDLHAYMSSSQNIYTETSRSCPHYKNRCSYCSQIQIPYQLFDLNKVRKSLEQYTFNNIILSDAYTPAKNIQFLVKHFGVPVSCFISPSEAAQLSNIKGCYFQTGVDFFFEKTNRYNIHKHTNKYLNSIFALSENNNVLASVVYKTDEELKMIIEFEQTVIKKFPLLSFVNNKLSPIPGSSLYPHSSMSNYLKEPIDIFDYDSISVSKSSIHPLTSMSDFLI